MLRPAYAQGPKGLLHLISTAAPRSRILECHIFGARCCVQPAACRHKVIATTSRRGARGADSCASCTTRSIYLGTFWRRSFRAAPHANRTRTRGWRRHRRRAHWSCEPAEAESPPPRAGRCCHAPQSERAPRNQTWFGLQRERRSRGSLQDCTRTPTWLPTTPRATLPPRQDPSSRSLGQTAFSAKFLEPNLFFVFLQLASAGRGRVKREMVKV